MKVQGYGRRGFCPKKRQPITGNVSHFTFWNVDDPFQYAMLDMKLLSATSQPLQEVRVKLTSLSDSSATYDYTDLNGIINGYVPINVQLRRDIFNECDQLVSTIVIGPFSMNTDLGNVTFTSITNQQTISGTVTDCNSLPVADGYVIINCRGKLCMQM